MVTDRSGAGIDDLPCLKHRPIVANFAPGLFRTFAIDVYRNDASVAVPEAARRMLLPRDFRKNPGLWRQPMCRSRKPVGPAHVDCIERCARYLRLQKIGHKLDIP